MRRSAEYGEEKTNIFKKLSLITMDMDEVYFENPPGRDKEYLILLKDLDRAIKMGRSTHRFIYGPTGTGKTYVANTFVHNFKKAMTRNGLDDLYYAVYVSGIYAKHQKANTDATAHFYEWLNNMVKDGVIPASAVRESGYKLDDDGNVIKPARSGKSASIVFQDIIRLLRRYTTFKHIFVFFDDIQLIKDWDNLIRLPVRQVEVSSDGPFFNTYYITNTSSIIEKKVARDLRAHFGGNVLRPIAGLGPIIFMPYNIKQIINIFKIRLRVALPSEHHPPENIIYQIAKFTEGSQGGNIRSGLLALQAAVEYAYHQNKKPSQLMEKEVDYILKGVLVSSMIEEIQELELHQKLILLGLTLIKDGYESTFDRLYRSYMYVVRKINEGNNFEIHPLKQTPFYERLVGLVDVGILTRVENTMLVSKKKRGRPPVLYGWSEGMGWEIAFSEYIKRYMPEDLDLKITNDIFIEKIREGKRGGIGQYVPVWESG